MGYAIIICQLDNLGVNQNQFYLVRTRFIHDACQQRVHTDRFTAAGSTCYQQMGHLGKINGDDLSLNVLAQTYA